ncbi:MAG: hypothetical protein WDO17_13910 [Alphaproteobacteria bacterium]
MMNSLKKIAIYVGVGLALAGAATAQDIPAGWSVETKPKGAILSYAPEKDGPRYLIVACLRDTDEIGVYSTGIGVPSNKPVVVMQLTNAGRKYSLRGDMGQDNINHQPAFRYETNIDARALSIFRAEFMPMLAGKGPLTVMVGDKSQQVPLVGVAEPLKKFSASCFGRS